MPLSCSSFEMVYVSCWVASDRASCGIEDIRPGNRGRGDDDEEERHQDC
jgi:hypothetical protein